MEKNNNEINNFDELYYDDLIYAIKKLAKFEVVDNEETNKRIDKRMVDIEVQPKEYKLSNFEEDLFMFVYKISKKVGVNFKGIYEISKYPDLVKEGLEEIEQKKLELKTKTVQRIK